MIRAERESCGTTEGSKDDRACGVHRGESWTRESTENEMQKERKTQLGRSPLVCLLKTLFGWEEGGWCDDGHWR